MIDLKDLNRAVCDLYRQALKAAGNAAEILPELESLEVADRILLAEGSDPLTACRTARFSIFGR